MSTTPKSLAGPRSSSWLRLLAAVALAVAVLAAPGLFRATSPADAAREGPSPCDVLTSSLSPGGNVDETVTSFGFDTNLQIPDDVVVGGLLCWHHYTPEGSGGVDGVAVVDSDGDGFWLVISANADSEYRWDSILSDHGFVDALPTEYGFSNSQLPPGDRPFWDAAFEASSGEAP